MRRPDPLVYFEVGRVERVTARGSYVWRPGFSRRADGGEQPWRTESEAREEARAIGQRVRFVRRGCS